MKKIFLLMIFLIPQAGFAAGHSEAFLKAEDYFKKGKFEMALLFYNKEILENPDNAQAYFKRAKILFQNKDYSSSLADALKAAELNPDQTEIQFWIASDQRQLGNFDKAIELYSGILKKDPQYSFVYLNLGNIYYTFKKDKDNTIRNWETFLVQKPDYEQDPEIRKAIALLKDPGFSFANAGGKNTSDTNAMKNGTQDTNKKLVIPDFLPDIKGEGSKAGASQQKDSAESKSIETE